MAHGGGLDRHLRYPRREPHGPSPPDCHVASLVAAHPRPGVVQQRRFLASARSTPPCAAKIATWAMLYLSSQCHVQVNLDKILTRAGALHLGESRQWRRKRCRNLPNRQCDRIGFPAREQPVVLRPRALGRRRADPGWDFLAIGSTPGLGPVLHANYFKIVTAMCCCGILRVAQ